LPTQHKTGLDNGYFMYTVWHIITLNDHKVHVEKVEILWIEYRDLGLYCTSKHWRII